MKPTVRHRILTLLEKQPGLSAAQIGRQLGITAAAARHHVQILGSDGRIVGAGASRPSDPRRGRPSQTYRISEKWAGDNLAALCSGLLREWPGASAGHGARDVADILAGAVARSWTPTDRRSPLAGRISVLMQRLNSAHYQARWEAGAEGPRILFGSCPYAAIIEEHPVLCRMDARLLANHIGGQAVQTAKIAPRGGTIPSCVFVIHWPRQPGLGATSV